MFIYSVAYTSYEDSSLIYFSHKEEYTEEEFEQIVFKATSNYLKALKEDQGFLYDELIEGPLAVSPANLDRLLGSRSRAGWPCLRSISDLFPDIGFVLEHPKYGFQRISPKQSVTFLGWQDPFDQEMGWVENALAGDCATVRLGAHLHAEGFTAEDSRMYKHDKKMEESEDRHALAQDRLCPVCSHPIRPNPLSPGDKRCWWCSTCGAGCGCDDTQYSFLNYDLDDVFENEKDFEDLYGW